MLIWWMTMVLIETLWNVNSNSNRNANFCVSVLIETLWNVNKIPAEIFRIPPAIVLIETLWNVNQVSGETYYEEY